MVGAAVSALFLVIDTVELPTAERGSVAVVDVVVCRLVTRGAPVRALPDGNQPVVLFVGVGASADEILSSSSSVAMGTWCAVGREGLEEG